MARVLVNLVDELSNRVSRYAEVEDLSGREQELPEFYNAGTYRRRYTVRYAPLLMTRSWQLIDRFDLGSIWKIENIEDSKVPGDKILECSRYSETYDDGFPNPLNQYVFTWGDYYPVWGDQGYAMSWGDNVEGY